MHKQLGKITSVHFGKGGYQDCQFGLFINLEFIGSGCCAQIVSGWDAASMPRSEYAKWTEEDRSKGHDELCRKVSQLIKDAQVDHVQQLINKPVEATFDSPFGQLTDWRILTEVI